MPLMCTSRPWLHFGPRCSADLVRPCCGADLVRSALYRGPCQVRADVIATEQRARPRTTRALSPATPTVSAHDARRRARVPITPRRSRAVSRTVHRDARTARAHSRSIKIVRAVDAVARAVRTSTRAMCRLTRAPGKLTPATRKPTCAVCLLICAAATLTPAARNVTRARYSLTPAPVTSTPATRGPTRAPRKCLAQRVHSRVQPIRTRWCGGQPPCQRLGSQWTGYEVPGTTDRKQERCAPIPPFSRHLLTAPCFPATLAPSTSTPPRAAAARNCSPDCDRSGTPRSRSGPARSRGRGRAALHSRGLSRSSRSPPR